MVVEERDTEAERKISDETRMALVVSQLEKILWGLPIRIAMGALATCVGRSIAGSHRDEDKRRNNRAVFGHSLDTVIRLEEEKVASEAIIRREIDRQVEQQQAANPLEPVNRKAAELTVRARMRAREIKGVH